MAPVTVLYDRDCGFCSWSAERLRAWDGPRRRLRFLPLQAPEAAELLDGLTHEERFASWHAAAGEELHSGGSAFGPVLRALPGGWPLAALTERLPRTTERLYRLAVENRERLGAALGQAACDVDPSRPRG